MDSESDSITSLISHIFLSHTQANGPVLHHPQFVLGTSSQKIEKSDSDSATGRCHGRPEPRNSRHRGSGKMAGRTAWKSAAGDGLVQSPTVHTTYDAHHQARLDDNGRVTDDDEHIHVRGRARTPLARSKSTAVVTTTKRATPTFPPAGASDTKIIVGTASGCRLARPTFASATTASVRRLRTTVRSFRVDGREKTTVHARIVDITKSRRQRPRRTAYSTRRSSAGRPDRGASARARRRYKHRSRSPAGSLSRSLKKLKG